MVVGVAVADRAKVEEETLVEMPGIEVALKGEIEEERDQRVMVVDNFPYFCFKTFLTILQCRK